MKKYMWLVIAGILFSGTSIKAQEKNAGDSLPDLYVITKSATRFFSDMDNLSSVVQIIPAGEKIQIYQESGEYFIASFGENEGYVLRRDVKFEESTQAYLEALWARQDRSAQAQGTSAQAQEDQYDELIRKYGADEGKKIFNRAIWRGMTRAMVLDSWGKPLRAYENYRNNPTAEMWMYRMAELYFENGVLVDWKRIR